MEIMLSFPVIPPARRLDMTRIKVTNENESHKS
jgi:hypothetical protein